MAFYCSMTGFILEAAEETTTAEGVEVYQVKAINKSCDPPILMSIMADKGSPQGDMLNGVSKLVAKKEAARVLVSGIMQPIAAIKSDETKEITKKPKVIVYAGAVRRIRADLKLEPEQAIVFGSGYARVQESRDDTTKRKPELYVSGSTESLKDAGEYSQGLQIIGDPATKTDVKCLEVDDGREVYMMANLFRSAGEYMGTIYDKLKARATMLQETDRVRSKGGKAGKTASMNTQLSSTFESSESTAEVMSADELCQQAAVSLADF